MGSQQLFLIVLTVLLVALAIFSGFQFAIEYYHNADRELLIENINILYDMAAKHRKKLVELGGGSGSYKGWEIPQSQLSSTDVDISFVEYPDRIIFLAKSNEIGWDNKNNIKVWVRYSDKNGTTIRYLN